MTCLAFPLYPRHHSSLLEACRIVPLHRRQSLACELNLAAQDIEPEAPALAETLMTIRALLLDCGEGDPQSLPASSSGLSRGSTGPGGSEA